MLVLSRKRGEKIRLGTEGEVTIQVVSIDRDTIKLGISAPQQLPVHREEIFQRINKKKKQDGDLY